MYIHSGGDEDSFFPVLDDGSWESGLVKSPLLIVVERTMQSTLCMCVCETVSSFSISTSL